ncbi:sulfite reductase flavoprotein subunit alpha [Aquabacter sediminis]|uniref:sulfite reductase flavoprotein subunit alpha n=1 Tax=Aquabacter sediminis TaxID=3029197 RepID=UPI00237DE662|nr:sulfite reductase flavoprotein subunit alpha [Aquabacter sp. P-9]MDE1567161.1 sulfite reductase flavoprotein subunit alpha [Aquabacter sp. P-9]
MLKALWFQTHWLLGITAGIVLAIVGVTGGLLSFEGEILRALNPGVMTVDARPGGPLPPAALLDKIRADAPDRTITALTVYADPESAARVTFAPLPGGTGGPRGEMRYVNPYDGRLLGAVAGQDTFRFIMQIHRWLAAGDVGKHIVGASTIALIVLSLSGLYLRWPRRPLQWRSWFHLNLNRSGRSLLWELHSVIGTWVLPFYLLASLTGLYWSYDWYRNALFDITGTPRPAQQGPRPGPPQAAQAQSPSQGPNQGPNQGQGQSQSATGPSVQGQGAGPASAERQPAPDRPRPSAMGQASGRPAAAALDIARLWAVFEREAGAYSTATLRLPQGNQPLTITYQLPNPTHERANNTLVLDATGAVRQHRKFDELPLGQHLMGSIFPLHAGSYFGMPGLILMMIASLLMPLFAVTGWMLYLDRRKKKGQARKAAAEGSFGTDGSATPVLVAFASQTGTAERLAWQTASALKAAGTPCRVVSLGTLTADALARETRVLFIVSTFGEGEAPDSARAFARAFPRATSRLDHVGFALLALGDHTYGHFCGFGRELEESLRQKGARPLFASVEMDGEDTAALTTWQARLAQTLGADVRQEWSAPDFSSWRLVERHCLNPGGIGLPTFHVVLEPMAGPLPPWEAGDIAQVRPRNDPERVRKKLAALSLDPAAPVAAHGEATALEGIALRGAWPGQVPEGVTAQGFADLIRPLPERDYSIASIPQDGRLEILVRQTRAADGSFGVGSGWLTAYAPLGSEIELRIKPNAGFHAPSGERPLILIGNGTGLAGLRAHLKARIQAGCDRNWLIFGERNETHDFYFRTEIAGWVASGGIARLDLAFSRDQDTRIYVQDRLAAAADTVKAWVDDGAAIFVCGSIAGMAGAVDERLRTILGTDELDRLAAEGLYRRDVY